MSVKELRDSVMSNTRTHPAVIMDTEQQLQLAESETESEDDSGAATNDLMFMDAKAKDSSEEDASYGQQSLGWYVKHRNQKMDNTESDQRFYFSNQGESANPLQSQLTRGGLDKDQDPWEQLKTSSGMNSQDRQESESEQSFKRYSLDTNTFVSIFDATSTSRLLNSCKN